MFLAGIDEAGLGPILGPYCAGLVIFDSQNSLSSDLYERLEGLIGHKPGDKPPLVCDSKILYSPQKGLDDLERSVLTFYSLLYGQPANFGEFLKKMTGGTVCPEALAPWYRDAGNLALPLCPENNGCEEEAGLLKKTMKKEGVRLDTVRLCFAPAAEFNLGLDRYGNKGRLCQMLLTPLMKEALSREELELTVDRQGGRRFYGDWLLELLPGKPLTARMELAKKSVYESGSKKIGFYVGGDNLALETALASLFAKYARECAMILFNRYWQKKAPHTKKTAGYYTDGRRFIGDLEKAGLMPENPDTLIRKK